MTFESHCILKYTAMLISNQLMFNMQKYIFAYIENIENKKKSKKEKKFHSLVKA